MTTRKIKRVMTSIPTLEGAGVHLNRAFGNKDVNLFDPFLLLDDFRSDTPAYYEKGFPWHPHRGMETITYVLKGVVAHGDSLNNRGEIGCGDVQWMTAGSGIIHQEMPQGDKDGKMEGFQLWANLPAASKMIHPRYRDIKAAQIPILTLDNGTEIKVICGQIGEVSGPVSDVMIEPEYLDVWVPANTTFIYQTPKNHTVFAYVHAGEGRFDEDSGALLGNKSLILFDQGDQVCIQAGDVYLRFLLISGRPLGEPVAWGGPIVMNTQEELQHAFNEFHNGTFIKHG
ncbi:pirin family protein [Geopsychrobacter electrodiphilus]|uniref:pirin family protein n=1 Tax=Geopsychrobacter electrodiphilus TaxID=225196 RepID=UPI000375319D|nr:pirin family protein [Geopsychrobacter electrodiphilus]